MIPEYQRVARPGTQVSQVVPGSPYLNCVPPRVSIHPGESRFQVLSVPQGGECPILYLGAGSQGLPGVVIAYIGVAVEAERNAMIRIVLAHRKVLIDVMNFNGRPCELVA